MKKLTENNISVAFKTYCPEIYELIKNEDWSKIHNNFITQFEKRKEETDEAQNNNLELPIYKAHFIDVLNGCFNENKGSLSFARMLNDEVKALLTELPEHKDGIKKMIQGKITNPEGGHFLTICGEIMALRTLLKNSDFELVQFEADFPNGRRKDFKLRNKINNKEILLEVYNYTSFDVEKIESLEDLKTFLFQRLKKKIAREIEGVNKADLTIPLTFMPVLWCFDMERLLPYKDFLIEFEDNHGKELAVEYAVFGFTGMVRVPYDNGYNGYIFASITKLLGYFEEVIS